MAPVAPESDKSGAAPVVPVVPESDRSEAVLVVPVAPESDRSEAVSETVASSCAFSGSGSDNSEVLPKTTGSWSSVPNSRASSAFEEVEASGAELSAEEIPEEDVSSTAEGVVTLLLPHPDAAAATVAASTMEKAVLVIIRPVFFTILSSL